MRKSWVILAMALLLVAACQETRTFDAPAVESEPEEEENQPEPVEEDARQALESFLEVEPVFKATYSVTNRFGEEEQTGTETVVVKGDNSKRSFQGESFYVLDDEVYLCVEEESVECYTIPQEEPPEPVDVSLPENVTVEEIDEREVAGEMARCFRITGDGEDSVDCRAEDGVLLYFFRREGEYEVEMSADSVSRMVSDSEFELPAEPQEFDHEEFYPTNAQPNE